MIHQELGEIITITETEKAIDAELGKNRAGTICSWWYIHQFTFFFVRLLPQGKFKASSIWTHLKPYSKKQSVLSNEAF